MSTSLSDFLRPRADAGRWIPAAEARRWADGVRVGAARRERGMRLDERGAIEAAYASASEWAWELADTLVDLAEAGARDYLRRQVRLAVWDALGGGCGE